MLLLAGRPRWPPVPVSRGRAAGLDTRPRDFSDGKFVALKGDSTWDLGATYIAISRLPWLTALAAWPTSGTWTRGAHFVAEAGRCDLGPPGGTSDGQRR
jgi:hypothetical protein